MMRKTLFAAICVLASEAVVFGLFEWHVRHAYVPPRLCRIGTFNLQQPSMNGANDENRIEEIAGIITSKDLQILPLQEIGAASLEELRKDLENLDSCNWKYVLSPQSVNKHVASSIRQNVSASPVKNAAH